MKNRIWTAVGIMAIFMVTGCGGDCKTFTNDVPETITPGLREHLGGLLTNTTWILVNDLGDTLVINAVGPYEEGVSNSQAEGSTECTRLFYGGREFSLQFNEYDPGEPSEVVGIAASGFDFFRVARSYRWDYQSDAYIAGSGLTLYDSLTIGAKTFKDVYIINGDSTDFIFAYNSKYGFVGQGTSLTGNDFYLVQVY